MDDDAMARTAMAQNLALTNLLTRVVFPAFASIDPEGFKQMLDDEAQHCERLLARPSDDQSPREAVFREGTRYQLGLLREAFDSIRPAA